MSTIVHFTGKDGKAASATFPTRALAEGYARTVKGARLVDTAAEVAPVVVTRCPDGTADAQRAASRAYHKSWRNESSAPLGSTREPSAADDAEHEAEMMAEHFGAARCAGQSQEDAWADWDYIRGHRPARPRLGLSAEERDQSGE